MDIQFSLPFVIMPQTDEAADWFAAVYEAIQQVPYGKCTSYGHIAILLGYPKRARQVGVCLKHLPKYDEDNPEMYEYHDRNVPWQRVVNSKGGISPRGDSGLAADRQADALGLLARPLIPRRERCAAVSTEYAAVVGCEG